MTGPGRVYLVGAGPGDPRLLTLRGAEVLRQADVVIYDRLAPSAVLDLAPTDAVRIYAGKQPGDPTLDQAAINAAIIEHARAGRTVVRLKGGDPFIFGRGGEEALACAEAGVSCEVIPGVSAAIAAPSAAGVPLTHRGLAQSVAFVSGSAAPGEDADLTALARAADTLVVLMAAAKLEETCAALIAAGRDAEQPAALIESATTAEERIVFGTLATIAAAAKAATGTITSPATLVCGPSVSVGIRLADLAQALGDQTEAVAGN